MIILRKTILLIILITFLLTYNIPINAFTSPDLNTINKNIVNIAVLLYDFDDPYIYLLKQSFEDIQKENQSNSNFVFFDGKNNSSTQYEQLDYALKNSFDLLIINLVDKKESTVEDILLKIKQNNIPSILFAVDPQVTSKFSNYSNRVVFIGGESTQPGIIQGKMIVNLWNIDKKFLDKNNDNILQYILLKGDVNNPIAIDRTNTVISTIKNSGIQTQQLEIIAANWLEELAKDSIESLFLKYNDRIEAIIANSDAMAIGAIEAIQKYGYNKDDKSKHIAVFGIDGLPKAKDLVDKGIMTGTIINDPKVFAEGIYTVGLNLINNVNPIKNTDYKIVNGEIIVPIPYKEYIKNQLS